MNGLFMPRFSWANFIVLLVTAVISSFLAKFIFCVGGTIFVNWISQRSFHSPLPRV